MTLKVWTCTDHAGHFVGVASVIVAQDECQARLLLENELATHGLDPVQPFTLKELDMTIAHAEVLQNGDY